MERREMRFEQDPSLDHVEIVVRAAERTGEVEALMEQIAMFCTDPLAVFDYNGCVRTLAPEDIVSVSTDGRMVHVVTESGSWYTRQSLQSLEAFLEGRRFVRISRFELVNLDKVRKYDFTVTGTLRLELVGGMETWASRRCIGDIRRRLKGKE